MILPQGLKDKKNRGGLEIEDCLRTIAVQKCLRIMIKTDINERICKIDCGVRAILIIFIIFIGVLR
jgi:hypothetical protein